MWDWNAADYRSIQEAELALLSSAVRGDAARSSVLLADDFVEIGRSGRRWTRSEIVEALQSEDPRPEPRTSEWAFNRLGSDLVLVTYRIHGAEGDSRHTSLWQLEGPLLRFHQGTVLPRA